MVAGRLDRRAVLLALSALLVASNTLAALAPNLATMLVARLMLGLSVGGFWTFAPGATGHLVPVAQQPRAVSYVLAGVSLATVAGVPAGALLADLVGWRAAFGVAAGLAALVLLVQVWLLPPMPPAAPTRAADLLRPLRSPAARGALGVTLFLVAGHFAAYTYLTPLLGRSFGLSPEGLTALLVAYGVTGFVGTFVGGRLPARHAHRIAGVAAGTVVAVLAFAAFGVGGPVAGTAVAAAWGFAFGLFPGALTVWMQTALPQHADAGQATLVTGFQVAIASGAFLGGVVVDAMGVSSAMAFGATLAAVAVGVVLRTGRARG